MHSCVCLWYWPCTEKEPHTFLSFIVESRGIMLAGCCSCFITDGIRDQTWMLDKLYLTKFKKLASFNTVVSYMRIASHCHRNQHSRLTAHPMLVSGMHFLFCSGRQLYPWQSWSFFGVWCMADPIMPFLLMLRMLQMQMVFHADRVQT